MKLLSLIFFALISNKIHFRVTGRGIFVNNKESMPDFIDKLSQKTILQFTLRSYEPIRTDSSNINTDIELKEDIDFSLDEIDSNNKENKRYIQIVYKKRQVR